jgi:hypothetical protein
MVANVRIQKSTIAVEGMGLNGGQLIGGELPLTLQSNGCIASKPTNIMIMAMRAERRQPEYSFAAEYDQVGTEV